MNKNTDRITAVQDSIHDQITDELDALARELHAERWQLNRAAANIDRLSDRATALTAWLQANPRSTPRPPSEDPDTQASAEAAALTEQRRAAAYAATARRIEEERAEQ